MAAINKLYGIILVTILVLTTFATFPSIAKVKNNLDESSSSIFEIEPYKLLEPGDIIIWVHNNDFNPRSVGHCTLFIGYNYATERYTVIHAISPVIKSEYYEIELVRMAILGGYEKIVIVKVNATIEQKQNAISFAELQVGKKFDYFFRYINKNHNTSQTHNVNANEWYCSELVWAAYYNCNNSFNKTISPDNYVFGEGIDIDYNGWAKDCKDFRGNKYSFVAPKDIIKDDDVEVTKIFEKNLRNVIYFRLHYNLFEYRINYWIGKIKAVLNR